MVERARVGIIGTGWVGSSVAISTLHAGFAREVWLCDTRAEIADGEAMDLAHGASFYPSAAVRAVPLDGLRETDAIVIAAGRGGRPEESRLALARDNAAIVREIGARLRGYDGVVVVVTNPVDVLTREVVRASGLPAARVIGTGTMLDTARLRQVLGADLGVAPNSVHAQVVGEHGDSEVVLWSGARAGGLPLSRWPGWSPARETAVAEQVRRAAYEIIRRKGATNHAIGLVTAALLRALLRDEQRVLTVARVQDGAFGLHDVALSLPTVVGARGAAQVIEPDVTEAEQAALRQSAETLRRAAETLV